MPRKVDTIGLSDCSPTAASTLATSSPLVFSGGMKIATIASTSGLAIAASSAALEVVAAGGGAQGDTGSATLSPAAVAASATSSASASELPTTATRVPARQRLVREQLRDVEHLVDGVDLDDARLAEHRVDRRLRRRWSGDRWPTGTPCVERPDFTATIGLRRPSRRAIRVNLRGLPIDSR